MCCCGCTMLFFPKQIVKPMLYCVFEVLAGLCNFRISSLRPSLHTYLEYVLNRHNTITNTTTATQIFKVISLSQPQCTRPSRNVLFGKFLSWLWLPVQFDMLVRPTNRTPLQPIMQLSLWIIKDSCIISDILYFFPFSFINQNPWIPDFWNVD